MADNKSILTLNLGSQRIGMARFSLGAKGSLTLRDYAFEEIPGDITSDVARKKMTAAAIKSLSSRLKAAGQEVNVALPSQNTITRFVKVPSLGDDQVDKIVGFEAQQAVPFPLTETVWDYQVLGTAGGEAEVAIAAIRADQVEEINGSVVSAGLSTNLVDAGPIALYNAFRYNYGEPAESTLLLDIGSRMTDAVFMEGHRLFLASFPFAGSNVTGAIAKEMEADFGSAESRKIADGFVNLGGNYADHEDPEIDAMSKIIRNQLTRIHSEINRRIQQYKTQGGAAPTSVYLAGAATALPYMKEFLEEKLRLPVHWFNSLQNVAVGPKVNADAVGRELHCLGELVGLALRRSSCPMELDLSPRSVETRKDVAAKKPKLIVAALALFSGLGALYANSHSAAGKAQEKLDKVTARFDDLNGFAKQIKDEESRQKLEESRGQYLKDAISGRQYWLSLANVINSKLTSAVTEDGMWITQMQPLDPDGAPIVGIPALVSGLKDEPVPESFKPKTLSAPPVPGKPGEMRKVTVDSIHLVGLYTKDKVRALFEALKDAKEGVFDIPTDWETKAGSEVKNWYNISVGNASLRASRFDMKLPLKQKIKLIVPADKK
jgi:type IV pilus assembly protein PilM